MEIVAPTQPNLDDLTDLLTRAEKAATSRRAGRRAEALTALFEVRQRLTEAVQTPTMREVESPNWSSARVRHMLERVKRATALAEVR